MGTITGKNRTPAIGYLRTSSATNVGADKDSDKRQRERGARERKRRENGWCEGGNVLLLLLGSLKDHVELLLHDRLEVDSCEAVASRLVCERIGRPRVAWAA